MSTAATCLAVVLQLASHPVATLGMDGKWTVPDWGRLEQFEHGQRSADACYARELRLHRDAMPMSETINDKCPGDAEASKEAYKRIIASDPIMRTCSNN